MAAKPIHMVGDEPVKLMMRKPATTRCGLVGSPMVTSFGRYDFLNASGGEFTATTRRDLTTCKKCRNLLDVGMIHRRSA